MAMIRIKQHSAFQTQLYVIKALLKREIVTRFGKYKLGILWMFVDPLMSVIVLGLLLGPLIGRSSGEIPYAFFLLCGFMMLKSVTGPLNMGIGAISSNKGLLVFKQVQPLDPFITRFIGERSRKNTEIHPTTFDFYFMCSVSFKCYSGRAS